ncbi:hypothetical protein [Microbacterium sp. CH12i]|uniref:hypothetical protein n=1 Tax=Microbacterium sp. CH12i TaxID=1479651 RepID=UPI000A7913A7|nr:hypothetical protein [Microbacterium sp. CH12i]
MSTDTTAAALAAAGSLTCAECGDQDATGYVVTILDLADPKHTRTEVCTRCRTEPPAP